MDSDIVTVALNAQAAHVFGTTTTCVCGYSPATGPDWDRHRMGAALGAVADWLAEHTSSTLTIDPFILAADWAANLIRQAIPTPMVL